MPSSRASCNCSSTCGTTSAPAAKEAAKDNPLKKALFDQTDLIRKRLAELGVTLEDRPGGTTWRVG